MHKRITKIYQAFKLSMYNSLQISYTIISTNKLCICEFHVDYHTSPNSELETGLMGVFVHLSAGLTGLQLI